MVTPRTVFLVTMVLLILALMLDELLLLPVELILMMLTSKKKVTYRLVLFNLLFVGDFTVLCESEVKCYVERLLQL
jgi:hypothetical protein